MLGCCWLVVADLLLFPVMIFVLFGLLVWYCVCIRFGFDWLRCFCCFGWYLICCAFTLGSLLALDVVGFVLVVFG